MNRFFTSLFLVTSVAVTFAGCDKMPFAKNNANNQSYSSAEMLTPIKGEVLAQVNNWRIGTEDFQTRLDILKENPQYAEADLDSTENKKAILQELIRLVSLAQEAKNRGFADDEQIKQAMADFERTLLVQKFVEKLSEDLTVTDIDIEDYYKNNAQLFTEPGSLQLKELAVASESEANAVLKRLLDGENFSTIAQQVSVLETRAQGGDLGSVVPVPDQQGGLTAVKIEEGQQPVEVKRFSAFWQTAATMQAGDDARKVKGEDGKFYVVKVTGLNQPKTVDLSAELKEQIKQVLTVERQNEELERVANQVKQNANLVINEDLL